MAETLRSVLAIDAAPFGDSVRLLAAMRALREVMPGVFIAAAAATGTVDLLRAIGVADDAVDLGVITPGHPPRELQQVLKRAFRLFQRTRNRNFDVVLDFSPRLETQILSRFVMRTRTLSPARLPRVLGILLQEGGPDSEDPYERVMQQIGVDLEEDHPGLDVPDEEHGQFESLLHRNGCRGGEPIVSLFSADAGGTEGWPVERFAETATRLVNGLGARVVVLDEPGSRSFSEAIGPFLPRTAIKLPAPSAMQLMAAAARASVVITDASGLARLTAETGTPVIEVCETHAPCHPQSEFHRIVRGSSRRRVGTDEVYELACVLIQSARSSQLFR